MASVLVFDMGGVLYDFRGDRLVAETSRRSRRWRREEVQPYPELKDSKKMIRVRLRARSAAQIGHRNVNRLVRDALWEKVALLVPNAPQFQPRRVQPPNGARATRRRAG